MAIAPMQTVSEAVTKALTNSASPLLPVFAFSHSPNCSKRSSMRAASPRRVPSARQSTTSMDFPLASSPASIFSIPCIAPATAMNRTLTPQAFVKESCCSSWISFPAKCPTSPPATMLAPLMIVPSPVIFCQPHLVSILAFALPCQFLHAGTLR